jgi:pyruvate kinase
LTFVALLLCTGAGEADAQRVKRVKTTGVIATLGPSTGNTKTIRGMLRAGARVARVNLSHNNARSMAKAVRPLRAAARAQGLRVPLLADLPGGKVRTGPMGSKAVTLKKGQRFDVVTGRTVKTSQTRASVAYSTLTKHTKVGDHLLIDDGNIELVVKSVSKNKVSTRVVKAGTMRSNIGLAIKGRELPFPAMTAQDRRKLKIAVKNGVDWVGVSMVQSPKNLLAVRRALDKLGAKDVKIVAKIESVSAMNNLAAIVKQSDIIMIARGDLGTAVGPKNLAKAEAQIAKVAKEHGKPFIAATNYMSNMIANPKPSAANKADVKKTLKLQPNWFMLNETAIGKHPVATVQELKALIPKEVKSRKAQTR